MTTPTWYGSIGILEHRQRPRRRRWTRALSLLRVGMMRGLRRRRTAHR